MQVKRTDPTLALLQGSLYTPAAATNVVSTWLMFGWQPPCRVKQEATRARLNPMSGVPQ